MVKIIILSVLFGFLQTLAPLPARAIFIKKNPPKPIERKILECESLLTPGQFFRESAVEYQSALKDEALSIIQTDDGTIKSLLAHISPPQQLLELYSQLENPPEEMTQLKWSRLDPEAMTAILRSVVEKKKTLRGNDRFIPDFTIKEEIIAEFSTQTPFDLFGGRYREGIYAINTKGFIAPQIEYKSPSDKNQIDAIELHFRTQKLSAGDHLKSVWNFSKYILNDEKPKLDIHVIAPLPIETLKSEPELTALRITESHRRINLLMELVSLFEGHTLNATDHSEYNPTLSINKFLRPRQLRSVYKYLIDRSQDGKMKLQRRANMSIVGFKGHDYYEADGLYGFQFRSINQHSDLDIHGQILDFVQAKTSKKEILVPAKEMDDWYKWIISYKKGMKTEDLISSTWYRRPLPKIYLQLPLVLKEEFSRKDVENILHDRSLKIDEGHFQEVKMLFHNWYTDPLVSRENKERERILHAQISAINEIKAILKLANPKLLQTNINQVLLKFWLNSGMAQKLISQFGLKKNQSF